MIARVLARRMEREQLKNTRLMRHVLFVIEKNTKEHTPVFTGTLRRSITTKISESGLRGEVGTNVFYGPFVHWGTRAHVISARHKRALFWRGARHPVGRVWHPGTRPQPFFIEGLQSSQLEILQILIREGEDLIIRWAR